MILVAGATLAIFFASTQGALEVAGAASEVVKLTELKALEIATKKLAETKFLEGVSSYRITAKFTERLDWNFRIELLPDKPDAEITIFVNADGSSKVIR